MSRPLVLRLARAFAGKGAAREPVAPPLAWTGEGSRTVAGLRRLLAALPAGPILRSLDGIARFLGGRPLLVLALVTVALPCLRLAGVGSAPVAAGLVLAAGAALALLLANALHEGNARRIVRRLLVAGLLLRAALAVFIGASGGFPDEYGTYHPLAAEAASCWAAGGPSSIADHPVVEGRTLYFTALSGVYFAAGSWVAVGRALGIAIGLLVAVMAGEAARALGGKRAAVIGVGILALHPEHAFWSATLSRDGLTTFLVLTALVAVARRPGTLLRGNLLLAAVPVAILAGNSFLVAGVLGATLAVLLLAEAVAAAGLTFRGIALPIFAVAMAGAALLFVGYRYGAWFTPDLIDAARWAGIESGPDFLPGFRFETGLDLLLYLPAGIGFVLAAPFPWDAVHAHRAAYAVFAAGGLAVAVFGLVGLFAAARRRLATAAPLLTFGILLTTLLALLSGFSGIVVRHRLPLTAVLAAGAAALLAGFGKRR